VGTSDPLLIQHSRLRDVEDTVAYYPVTAYIRHRDGISEANLFYRASTETAYSEAPMMLVDTAANIWASLIPAYPAGTEVQYYIAADANDGKHQVRPIVAPEGYFKFKVLGEPANQPPSVHIVTPVDESVFNIDEGHALFTIEATDPDGVIVNVKLNINFEDVAIFDTLPYTFDWIFPGVGTYYAHAQATDDDGAIVFSTLFKITIEESTATHAVTQNLAITVSPNPVDIILEVRNDESATSISDIEVYNTFGQIQSVSTSYGGKLTTLDFSLLPAGVYILRIREGDNVWGYRVVKQ